MTNHFNHTTPNSLNKAVFAKPIIMNQASLSRYTICLSYVNVTFNRSYRVTNEYLFTTTA